MQHQPVPRAQGGFGYQRMLVVEQHQVVRLFEYARDIDGDGFIQLQ